MFVRETAVPTRRNGSADCTPQVRPMQRTSRDGGLGRTVPRAIRAGPAGSAVRQVAAMRGRRCARAIIDMSPRSLPRVNGSGQLGRAGQRYGYGGRSGGVGAEASQPEAVGDHKHRRERHRGGRDQRI